MGTSFFPNMGYLPSGSIIMWSGPQSTIPSGWHLCDGTNGTYDFRGRYAVGCASDIANGATADAYVDSEATEVQLGSGIEVIAAINGFQPANIQIYFIQKL